MAAELAFRYPEGRPFPEADRLALDIETDQHLKPWEGWPVVLGLSDGRDALLYDLRPPIHDMANAPWLFDGPTLAALLTLWQCSIGAWLADEVFDRAIIAHNITFDLLWLMWWFGVEYPERAHCTMASEQLILRGWNSGFSLAAIAARRLSIELDKDLQVTFTLNEPTPEQLDYVAGDIVWLHDIADAQLAEMGPKNLLTVYEIEHAAHPVWVEMAAGGLPVDIERLQRLVAAEQVAMEAVEAGLVEALTAHVVGFRIQRRDAMQSKLDLWEAERAAEEQRLGAAYDDLDPDSPLTIGHWRGVVDEQGNPRWAERTIQLWRDQTPDKDGQPSGRKRYIRSHLTLWRKRNPRPATPKLDLSPINLGSPQQVLAAFAELGIRPLDPKTGKPTTRGGVLKALLPDVDPEIADSVLRPYIAWRKSAKIVQAFGDSLIEKIGADGALHPMISPYGANTGRPTMSQPNLLNQPGDKKDAPPDQQFRRCFRARAGHAFGVLDYSQIELRIAAELARDRAMIQAFRDGVDLHTLSAAKAYSVPLEEVVDRQRKVGKTANFGILYGLGADALRANLAAERIQITRDEAKAVVDGWKAGYPAVADAIRRWGQQGLDFGYTTTAHGRRLHYPPPDGRNGDAAHAIRRKAANFPIQGTAADIMKLAMSIARELIRPLGGRVVLQVYDELVIEAPEDSIVAATARARAAMLAAAREVLKLVPAEVDWVIGPSWSEYEARLSMADGEGAEQEMRDEMLEELAA